METILKVILYALNILLIITVYKLYPVLLQDKNKTIDYFRVEVDNLKGKLTI